MLAKYFTKHHKSREIKSTNIFDTTELTSGHQVRVGPEAYKSNVIVHKCVNLIAQSASHVPWIACQRKNNTLEKLSYHPLLTLLNRPNMKDAGVDFVTEIIANLLLFGNAYILGCGNEYITPQELYLLHPDKTDIIVDNGKQIAYRYKTHNGERRYTINTYTSRSKVLHIKTYNPYDAIYGMSCLSAAALAIDTHNHALQWNNALLKNGARPSGALVMKDSCYLSDDQFERLKEQFYDKYTGSSSSGKPIILEGGLDWKEMSVSPKDMDFIETKNTSAREIALAFGVPPQLLGISGDNTYSNMQEARLALWEETLIPLLDKISDSLTHWLASGIYNDIVISFDRDAISALTDKRENLWSKITDSNFMTINEKRAFVGLRPIEGGDVLQ